MDALKCATELDRRENMEPKTIQVDGVPTVIRTMEENYIVGEDPSKAGIEYAIKCWPGKNVPGVWPNLQ